MDSLVDIAPEIYISLREVLDIRLGKHFPMAAK